MRSIHVASSRCLQGRWTVRLYTSRPVVASKSLPSWDIPWEIADNNMAETPPEKIYPQPELQNLTKEQSTTLQDGSRTSSEDSEDTKLSESQKLLIKFFKKHFGSQSHFYILISSVSHEPHIFVFPTPSGDLKMQIIILLVKFKKKIISPLFQLQKLFCNFC